MTSIIFLTLGFGVMLTVIAAAYCAVLAFHDPHRPGWMNSGWADNTATIGLVTAAIANFAWLLKAMAGFGADPLVAVTIEIAAGMFFASVLWRRMHMRERIDAASRGMSPFAELRHIRHSQRKGFDRGGYGPGALGAA